MTSLHLDITGLVATLTLNHGKANEMGRAELDDVVALCEVLEQGEVRALITRSTRLSSKGTPIFISGANVTERRGWTDDAIRAHVRFQRSVLRRLREVPVFHIACIDGLALGWGTEFTLACDYRLASRAARFGLPETGLGILPGAGGSTELAMRIGPNQALRLGMTGEQIDADEALRIGLIDECCPDAETTLARAHALAERVAKKSPSAVAAYKVAVLATLGSAEREAVEAAAYEHCVSMGDAALGRANFAAIAAGQSVVWGPYRAWKP